MKVRWLGVLLLLAAVAYGLGMASSASASAQDPRTITVQPGESIQAAIDSANAGDTIEIQAGTYTENLTINKGIKLHGAGRDATILIGTVSITTADEASIEGLTIKGGRGLTIRDSSGITISDNTFSESRSAGLLLSNAAATIEANLITGNRAQGILITFNSDVVLRANTITQNGKEGVNVQASSALLESNVIKGNGGCGVKADSSSTVEGEDNAIVANGRGNLCGVSRAILETTPPPAPENLRVDPSSWTNGPITVDWDNPEDPSGIAAFWYKIGAKPAGPEDGARRGIDEKPLVLESPPEGEQPIYLWLEDGAGNKSHENVARGTLKFDKTPPEINPAVTPEPNTSGWNNSDVTVRFDCKDELSGVESCVPAEPVHLTEEGKDQVVRAEAVDNAGNHAETEVRVSIDKQKPVLTLGKPQGTLGNEGWYISDVVVPFTATDNLSGFAPDGRLRLEGTRRSSGEGTDVKVHVSVSDLAGNTAEEVLGPFKVDKTPPTGSLIINEGAERTDSLIVTLRIQARDNLSGLAEMRFSNDGRTWSEWEPFSETKRWDLSAYGGSAGEGTKTVWGQVKDRAGNISEPFSDGISYILHPAFTIRVPEDYSTIQEAIAAAPEGYRILIGPGTWEENLVIGKSLTLKGAGLEESVIKGKEEGEPVIRIESDSQIEVVIESLTVAKAKGYYADGIRISGKATVTIRNSKISENGDDGIEMVGPSQATISGSQISGNGESGIVIGGSSQATISGSQISGNDYSGIYMEGSSQATISGSEISGNSEHGIEMFNSSQATISGSEISGNDYSGIYMEDSSQATISDSKISENGDDGIFMRDSSQATIRDNEIFGNKGYSVALYQRPCYDTDHKFEGKVEGGGNRIYNNGKGNVCPSELRFLMTSSGGCYGPMCD